MSLFDMDTATTDKLPADELENAVRNYVVSSLQAIDWEPAGRTSDGAQVMGKSKRAFSIKIVMLEEPVARTWTAEDDKVPFHHEFAVRTPGDPYCVECQLPRENARHRGAHVITLQVHGNDLDTLRREVNGMKEFIHLGDHADLWVEEVT